MKKESIIAYIERDHKWEGNILQKMAEEIARSTIPIEEVVKNDVTEKLLKELEREVKNKEIISLQINAKPRLAKSTLGILLVYFIDGLLKKYKMKDKDIEVGMKNIARDQNERAKMMRNPNLMYDIIMTDESNALEETGENATVEKAQRDVFSDVQAGRYIHGIWICPEGTIDKNCDIKLEIRNKDKGLIHTRVYYFMKSSFYYGWVMIGVADFDVKNLIKEWLDLEPIFFRYLKERKESDKKKIDIASKNNFYINYMCKKYEKMELMNREGILHARDLDYAEMRRKIVNDLKPLAETTIVPMTVVKNTIKSKIETEFSKRTMPLSMLGKDIEFERVLTMLEMFRAKSEIEINIEKMKRKLRKGDLNVEQFNDIIKKLELTKEELEKEIKVNEMKLIRLEEINKKYNEFL